MSLGEMLAGAARVMNLLHEVRWDRCAGDERGGSAFGWIDRGDGRCDFCLILYDAQGVGFATSSALLSAEFSRRVYGSADDHRDCRRVEDVFGDAVANKVVLGTKEAA